MGNLYGLFRERSILMKRLITIPLLFISLWLSATTYYVSTSGNNGANGTTTGTPWQTLAYAEANATSPGDIIALKRGDIFTLSSTLTINSGGTVGNPITWDGYLWGSGDTATIKTATLWFTTLIRVVACDYLTIQKITFDCDNNNSDGIIIGGSVAQNGESNIIIQDCNFYEIGVAANIHAVLVQPYNNDIEDITVQRNNFNKVAGCAVFMYPSYAVGSTPAWIKNAYIGYNTIKSTGIDPGGEMIGCNNGVDGCIIEHNTGTPGIGTTYGIIFGSNLAYYRDIFGYFPKNITVRYNDIRADHYPAIFIQGGQAVDINIYCNKLYRQDATGGLQGTIRITSDTEETTYEGADIDITNNTIVSDNASNSCISDAGGIVGTTTVINNILIKTATSATYGLIFASVEGAIVHSYNSWYVMAEGDPVYYFTTTPYSILHLADAASIEATGVFSNPTLTDLAGFDWTLQAGSPVIGKGIGVGLTVDFAGHLWDNPVTIGAYAHGTSEPVGSDPVTVETTSATFKSISGTITGNVTDDGGGTISARGVCWSTSINPTISNSKVLVTGTTGSFTATLSPLLSNTTYHVRAFATNESGTAYGADISFTTPSYTILTSGGKVLMSGGKVLIIK
jgi:hypothetical protein